MMDSYITEFQSSPVRIWKTVSTASRKLSYVERVCVSRAPKSCMPRMAKMVMKSMGSTTRATMDLSAFTALDKRLHVVPVGRQPKM